MVGVRMCHDNGVDTRVRLIELVADIIAYRVTVSVCSRSGINQDESSVGTFDQRAVALSDLNEVQDQLGLRLAPGSWDRDEGKNGYEGNSGISQGPPPPVT